MGIIRGPGVYEKNSWPNPSPPPAPPLAGAPPQVVKKMRDLEPHRPPGPDPHCLSKPLLACPPHPHPPQSGQSGNPQAIGSLCSHWAPCSHWAFVFWPLWGPFLGPWGPFLVLRRPFSWPLEACWCPAWPCVASLGTPGPLGARFFFLLRSSFIPDEGMPDWDLMTEGRSYPRYWGALQRSPAALEGTPGRP